MRIVVLAGGIGAARFLLGLRARLGSGPEHEITAHEITVIGNTADDITLFGLHVSPDLDTVMYTLGGGIHPEQGWGRADETRAVQAELAAYGQQPDWFALGDRDIATHLVRTRMLHEGTTLSAATAALCARWQPGVRLLPMSDDLVTTMVTIADDQAAGGTREIHFQEYWVRLRAEPAALAVVAAGAAQARPAPGVREAIAAAEVIVLPPSNPVVSIGTILAVPGIRDALVAAAAPVVGLSPIVGGAPVRGMADKMLAAIGVETAAGAVARHYGPDLLDGWLLDSADAAEAAAVEAAGIRARAVPLLMRDLDATTAMAAAALDLAAEIAGGVAAEITTGAGGR